MARTANRRFKNVSASSLHATGFLWRKSTSMNIRDAFSQNLEVGSAEAKWSNGEKWYDCVISWLIQTIGKFLSLNILRSTWNIYFQSSTLIGWILSTAFDHGRLNVLFYEWLCTYGISRAYHPHNIRNLPREKRKKENHQLVRICLRWIWKND